MRPLLILASLLSLGCASSKGALLIHIGGPLTDAASTSWAKAQSPTVVERNPLVSGAGLWLSEGARSAGLLWLDSKCKGHPKLRVALRVTAVGTFAGLSAWNVRTGLVARRLDRELR